MLSTRYEKGKLSTVLHQKCNTVHDSFTVVSAGKGKGAARISFLRNLK